MVVPLQVSEPMVFWQSDGRMFLHPNSDDDHNHDDITSITQELLNIFYMM